MAWIRTCVSFSATFPTKSICIVVWDPRSIRILPKSDLELISVVLLRGAKYTVVYRKLHALQPHPMRKLQSRETSRTIIARHRVCCVSLPPPLLVGLQVEENENEKHSVGVFAGSEYHAVGIV